MERAHLARAMHTTSRFPLARAGAAALCLLAAGLGACKPKGNATPEKEPPPASAPSAAPTTSAATDPAAIIIKEIPTVAAELFAPPETHLKKVFQVEGALLVTEQLRVGRVVGEGVEWVGDIPPRGISGMNRIDSVHGRWPDRIDVVYSADEGRAPVPTYFPLTGKGNMQSFAPGGGLGIIHGVATVGESTIIAGYELETGPVLITVRGPKLPHKPQTPTQAGCKPGEVEKFEFAHVPPAIAPEVLGASPAGTLMTMGQLCQKRGPAAEVWDAAGKSRIVDLSRLVKKVDYASELLPGKGDELFFFAGGDDPILHYQNGELKPLPRLERPVQKMFVSPGGQLHASDGLTIHRYGDGKWAPVAHLAWPSRFDALVIDDKEALWAASEGRVYRLRSAASVDFKEGCATPFVYLYDVSPLNDDKFTFPATRKALATFPEVSQLGLVEVSEAGARRLGVTVASKAQGEAVIAHVKATMKDEEPRLLCYAPRSPRKIAVTPKGK